MKLKTLALIAALSAATPALAHDAKSLHGGRIVFAGQIHVEMVATGDTVQVYLVDHHNKQMAPDGYKGLAILSVDGKSQRIALQADGDRLVGRATGDLPAAPKGVVQITQPDGKTVSAKF
jgi:cephalosporin hydroxylase